MFAKLLAELKRIAILLQSKKLVDKDYVPDEGGSESDDKFYLLKGGSVAPEIPQMAVICGISFQKLDLTKIDFTTITGDCLANELFTTKGIDVINKIIKSLHPAFIGDGYRTKYYFSTIESKDYNSIWLPKSTDEPDFMLRGYNDQTEKESIRGIIISVTIDDKKYLTAALSKGTYLTENTQFIYVNDETQEH